jgi:hypothetical protein
MSEGNQDGASTVTSKYKEALKDWLAKKDAKKKIKKNHYVYAFYRVNPIAFSMGISKSRIS